MGFPVRLAIAALIVALFVPSAISAAEYFTESSEITEARHVADSVVSAAGDAWYSGRGSVRDISIHVPSGYALEFGGDGVNAYSYRILKGDEVVETVYADSPRIRFLDGSCTLAGHCDLRITCGNDSDGNYGITVAAV